MLFCGGPLNMLRVFRLLPKLSHGAKNWQGGICRLFRLFRLFMLLRKLSHPAKIGTWQFRDVLAVQAVQAFAQTFSEGIKFRGTWQFRTLGCSRCSGCSGFCPNFLRRDKVHRHVAVSGFQDVQDVQAVQAFAQTFSRDKVQRHVAVSGTVQDVQAVQAFAQTLLRDKFQEHVAVSGCSRCSRCSGFCASFSGPRSQAPSCVIHAGSG
jgi:Pyruvate/2-oxoacid:ferredoxin oxidoreductase delta subunit